MVTTNTTGILQISMNDGSCHEINLKKCHTWTREGRRSCPDVAAEHSDIATGGIDRKNHLPPVHGSGGYLADPKAIIDPGTLHRR